MFLINAYKEYIKRKKSKKELDRVLRLFPKDDQEMMRRNEKLFRSCRDSRVVIVQWCKTCDQQQFYCQCSVPDWTNNEHLTTGEWGGFSTKLIEICKEQGITKEGYLRRNN